MTRETAALVRHSARRFRAPVAIAAAALGAFQVLLCLAARELQREGMFQQILGLIPPFARELFGPVLVSMMSFPGIMALGYYHVAIVAVLVGLVIAIATEPAGEVESGFADLVLARAVPRGAVMTRSIVLRRTHRSQPRRSSGSSRSACGACSRAGAAYRWRLAPRPGGGPSQPRWPDRRRRP